MQTICIADLKHCSFIEQLRACVVVDVVKSSVLNERRHSHTNNCRTHLDTRHIITSSNYSEFLNEYCSIGVIHIFDPFR